jgi:hypothetical protein
MPKRAITVELYDSLLQAFRAHPGQIGKVAQLCDVEWRTAKRAWERGWLSKQKPWAMAVMHVNEDGEAAAKHEKLERRKNEQRELERRVEQMARVKAEFEDRETKIIQQVSNDVLAAALIVGKMVPTMGVLLQKLDLAVQTGKLSIGEMTKLVGLFVTATNRVTYAGEVAVQMSRLARGATTANLGLQPTPQEGDTEGERLLDAITLEEAETLNGIMNRYIGKGRLGPKGGAVVETEGESTPEE